MTLFRYYKFLLCASKTQEQLNPNKIHKTKNMGIYFQEKKKEFCEPFRTKTSTKYVSRKNI